MKPWSGSSRRISPEMAGARAALIAPVIEQRRANRRTPARRSAFRELSPDGRLCYRDPGPRSGNAKRELPPVPPQGRPLPGGAIRPDPDTGRRIHRLRALHRLPVAIRWTHPRRPDAEARSGASHSDCRPAGDHASLRPPPLVLPDVRIPRSGAPDDGDAVGQRLLRRFLLFLPANRAPAIRHPDRVLPDDRRDGSDPFLTEARDRMVRGPAALASGRVAPDGHRRRGQ